MKQYASKHLVNGDFIDNKANEPLPDLQCTTEGFPEIHIGKVGMRGIKVPMVIKTPRAGEVHTTVATISSYCSLVPTLKGINMSRISTRIIEELENSKDGISDLRTFAHKLHEAHGANDIYIKARFDYTFVDKTPITGLVTHEPVKVIFESKLTRSQSPAGLALPDSVKVRNYLTVETTEMSLCPCSKTMSLLLNNVTDEERELLMALPENLFTKVKEAGFGGHSQKSVITTKVELTESGLSDNKMWIEDLVAINRRAASAPTFTVLKRYDEKWVTEASYMGKYIDPENGYQMREVGGGARFVEDIARHAAQDLDTRIDGSIRDYVVVVNNQESIHSEDIFATAILDAGRLLQ